MSSVQQNLESIVIDDRGLASAEISAGPDNINTPLDLEGIATQDSEIGKVIAAERLKATPTEARPEAETEAKKVINHPIAKAAEKSLQAQIEPIIQQPPIEADQIIRSSVATNIIREGKLRVGKPVPLVTETALTSEREAPTLREAVTLQPAPIIDPEILTVPPHLLEKLNLKSTPILAQPTQENIVETQLSLNQLGNTLSENKLDSEPQQLQAEHTTLSLEQAMKLDLSLAKIGMGQSTKPLSFRGHRLSSGTMLDRLITAIADFVKRLEMRFVSFLTRKRMDRKALKAKPIKVVLPTEDEDSLYTASFSNTLSQSRSKRKRWLARFRLEQN